MLLHVTTALVTFADVIRDSYLFPFFEPMIAIIAIIGAIVGGIIGIMWWKRKK